MKLQILGSGCPSCIALEENVTNVVKELALKAEIVKITDIDQIMDMGVMMTPALAIDGVVKSVGKVLTKNQIKDLLQ